MLMLLQQLMTMRFALESPPLFLLWLLFRFPFFSSCASFCCRISCHFHLLYTVLVTRLASSWLLIYKKLFPSGPSMTKWMDRRTGRRLWSHQPFLMLTMYLTWETSLDPFCRPMFLQDTVDWEGGKHSLFVVPMSMELRPKQKQWRREWLLKRSAQSIMPSIEKSMTGSTWVLITLDGLRLNTRQRFVRISSGNFTREDSFIKRV